MLTASMGSECSTQDLLTKTLPHKAPQHRSTANNSQANQQVKGANSVQLNKYINEKKHQIMSRLTNLMQYEGNVAQQLHQYYIRSLTQLQSSSSSQQPSGHQQTNQQSPSKLQYEDLFFITNRQCEVLEEHMQESIKNGITAPPCGSTGGASCDGVLDLLVSPASDSWRAADNVPHAHTVLNYWYEANKHDPYPTNREALQLGRKCGMKVAQVKKWMSNKRTRCHNTRKQLKPAQKTVK